jgi:hypothetical protein
VDHHVDTLKQRHPIDAFCQIFNELLLNRRAEHHGTSSSRNHPVTTICKSGHQVLADEAICACNQQARFCVHAKLLSVIRKKCAY